MLYKLTLIAIMQVVAFTALGQTLAAKQLLVKRFMQSHDYQARDPYKKVPWHLRHFVSKQYREQYDNGPFVFKNKLLRPHESRVMLCSFRRNEEYIFVYRHGTHGVDEHILYVNKANKTAVFFGLQMIFTGCDDLTKSLENMELSDDGVLVILDYDA